MKNIKTLTLAVLATIQMTAAIAGTDPVVEQINITQDAVKVALEEMEQGKNTVAMSADTDKKMKAFSKDASAALVRFEEAVRTRVLQSFSVLVNQYNRTYENRALGDAREEILTNLRQQLSLIQKDKSQIYREAYLELYSVLPDFPVQYDTKTQLKSNYYYDDGNGNDSFWHDYTLSKSNFSCIAAFNGGCNRDVNYLYAGDVYFAKSKTKKLSTSQFIAHKDNSRTYSVEKMFEVAGMFTMTDSRDLLLEGCYTSSCYFATQAQYTVYKSMVESSLARNIVITLIDGTKINISKDVSRNGRFFNVLSSFLNGVKTEGLINDLPLEATPERVAILSEMNGIMTKGSCRVKKQLNALCDETREGCLKDAEAALFKSRFGRAASCL